MVFEMVSKGQYKPGRVTGRKRGRRLTLLGIPQKAIDKMLTQIRAGGSPWVAAKLIGIDSRTFLTWMQRGREPDCTEPELIRFHREVSKAYSVARLNCENRVHESNPEFWLTRSPGGRTLDPLLEPGWTDTPKEGVQINIDQRSQELNISTEHESQAPLVFGQALQVLADLGIVQVADPKLLTAPAKSSKKPSAVVPKRIANDTNGYAGEPFVN